MSSIKTIREKIPSIEDSLFNSKLFLNVNLSNEQNLNSSFAKDSENPNEIDDITSTCFLSKDLMDELNSSDSDISLKDEKPALDKNSFLNLVKGGDKYISNGFTNNIGNKDLFPYDFNQRNNNIFFNCRDYMNSYNINIKRYKNMIKDKKRDWVCQLCFNLNYSFRTECNRCKLPKEKCLRNLNYMY